MLLPQTSVRVFLEYSKNDWRRQAISLWRKQRKTTDNCMFQATVSNPFSWKKFEIAEQNFCVTSPQPDFHLACLAA
jgi:hypothetical protein